MEKLTRADLMSLETYAANRNEFRSRVLAHKQARQLQLGDNAVLIFEDRLTVQYQVQEMLRIERIFEAAGIEDELSAYNPLVPDGTNLKATLMLEYEDADVRKQTLPKLIGIEDKVWIQVDGFEPIWAIADEDLERENEEKTSAVHFLRFEFSADMVAAAKTGANLSMGIDHPNYNARYDALPEPARVALVADFD